MRTHPRAVRRLPILRLPPFLRGRRLPSILVHRLPAVDLRPRAVEVLERRLHAILGAPADPELPPRRTPAHPALRVHPALRSPRAAPALMRLPFPSHLYYDQIAVPPALDRAARHSRAHLVPAAPLRVAHTDRAARGGVDAADVLGRGVASRRAAGMGAVVGRVERDLGRGQLCAVGGVLASGVRRVIVYQSMYVYECCGCVGTTAYDFLLWWRVGADMTC